MSEEAEKQELRQRRLAEKLDGANNAAKQMLQSLNGALIWGSRDKDLAELYNDAQALQSRIEARLKQVKREQSSR